MDILLLIVGRVYEYARIETASNPVATVDHNTVHISLQEFIIENDCPLSVVDFSMTVRHERPFGPLPANVLRCEGLEGGGEL
jgi:hypothetical protein